MKIKTKNRQIENLEMLQKNILFDEISNYEASAAIRQLPITWEKALDFSVFDDKKNKWIDLTSGIFVTNSGHSNSKINEMIKKQLDSNLVFSYNYPTNIKKEFLKKLFDISPKYFNKAILLMTGSEAVDAAYKLIKMHGKKEKRRYIISFKGSYHGRGLSNDLISGGKEKSGWANVKDDDVVFLDFPYNEDDSFSPEALPSSSEISAFFLETFQGWGAWFYPSKFISDLYSYAKSSNILVCFDEMQAGFYRLGPVYGYMTYGKHIQPDIICIGKAISGSLPIAAVLSRKEVIDISTNADLHGTHSGNPLCCAAALANLEFLTELANTDEFKLRLRTFEKGVTALSKMPILKKVNVRGMIAGLIFDTAEIATKIVIELISQGVLPVCTNRNSIKLAPPLTISIDALEEAICVIGKVLQKMKGQHGQRQKNDLF
ncbi:MAG: aminotransferase class III-fold pyridoxal phosphate-dependent enzyme [Candidatus Riflebacteria bacterium]|nr:aminotransferase class III-fold pyridoxal phosphate-dependent enzyme [Candidatus Riflebacteria bacterium]